jgi:hypothetical protein
MGKRIELPFVYRPKPNSSAKASEGGPVRFRLADRAQVSKLGSNPHHHENGECLARVGSLGSDSRERPAPLSKPGRKPKVEVPADVQAWLTKHGLRVVPKAKAK